MWMKVKAVFIYADDGKVASTDPLWLHNEFDTLTVLFYRLGLNMNVCKTMGMVCHTFRAAGVRAYESYIRQIMGTGRRYKEIQWERVNYPEYGKDLTRGSLAVQFEIQHGVAKGGSGHEGDGDDGGDKLRKNRIAFPDKAGLRPCSVEGYGGRAETQNSMKMHFWHRHGRDTVVIM